MAPENFGVALDSQLVLAEFLVSAAFAFMGAVNNMNIGDF